MFNTDSLAGGLFEHPLNEYKSIEVTRIFMTSTRSTPSSAFTAAAESTRVSCGIPSRSRTVGLPPRLPQWGGEYKRALQKYFTRSMYVVGHTTSLPVADNSISLDDTVKDAWGLPAMRVTYKDHPDDLKTNQFMLDRSMEILEAAGAQDRWAYPVQESTYRLSSAGNLPHG